MLSFKRILNSEFPLRMLPLDALEVQDEDGFDMIVQTPTISNTRVKKSKSSQTVAQSQSKEPAAKSIYLLCFVNLNQIEAYLQAHGLLKAADDLSNQQDFIQLSKSIMTNSK